MRQLGKSFYFLLRLRNLCNENINISEQETKKKITNVVKEHISEYWDLMINTKKGFSMDTKSKSKEYNYYRKMVNWVNDNSLEEIKKAVTAEYNKFK